MSRCEKCWKEMALPEECENGICNSCVEAVNANFRKMLNKGIGEAVRRAKPRRKRKADTNALHAKVLAHALKALVDGDIALESNYDQESIRVTKWNHEVGHYDESIFLTPEQLIAALVELMKKEEDQHQ